MVECETSESTSSPFIGIILTLMACLCYAFGNCLQRYSLLRQPHEKVFKILNRHMGWLLGAFIYFSANGLYAVALSFAPVSLLAAVFSLTILANATCANFMLGDKIPKMAYPGYFLVLLGSIIFSISVEAEVCHFGGEELKEVLTSGMAMTFWIIVLVIIEGGIVFAYVFERRFPLDTAKEEEGIVHEAPSNGTMLLARILYPSALGAIEATGSLILKAINSLLTTMATETDENDGENQHDSSVDEEKDLGLWIGLMLVGVVIFSGIVMFLRLVYARFEITSAFPVEFGTLILFSVVGGFAVFEDHQYVTDKLAWTGVSLAGASILGGITIVALVSWKASLEPLR